MKKKKQSMKLLAGLFMLCMMLAGILAMPRSMQAADSDFVIEDGVLTKYQGSVGDVIIPDGATSIGEKAFFKCSSLTSVVIPSGVTSIGEQAFYGCTNLSRVEMPSGMTSIGDVAFCECESLSRIEIPSSVTSIGNSAFDGCTSLSRIDIPSSVVEIENNVFSGCNSLLEINVDAENPSYSSADGILFDKDKTMLKRCPLGKIGNIAIPSGVTSIEGSAFSGCKNLKKVTIPSSVTEIGGFAFFSCKNLTVIRIPSSVTSIGGAAFARCENLRELSILNLDAQLGDDVYDDILRSDEEEDNAFKNPVITIKGYAGSAAQQLVNEKIRHGCTQFQFVPLSRTGSKDAAWEIAALLQKVKAPKRLSVRKGASKTIKVTLPKGFRRVTTFSGKNKKGEVKLTFCSANPNIVSVGTKGKVTAKQTGTVKIISRLTAHDGKQAQLRVLVTEMIVK